MAAAQGLLSNWEANLEERKLYGQLILTMPVAVKGGSIGLNPMVVASFDLLGQTDSKRTISFDYRFCRLSAKFYGLRATGTMGIQAGHMKLQAKPYGAQVDESCC